MGVINYIKSFFDRIKFGASRSPQWFEVRKQHLKSHPVCEISGSSKDLEVHHILPFYKFPELELEPSNLITLSGDYHLIFGHLGNFKSFND